MGPRWLNKLRSLYASEAENNALPDRDRYHPWAGAAQNVDREFVSRTTGKVLLDLGCGPPESRVAVCDIPCSQCVKAL